MKMPLAAALALGVCAPGCGPSAPEIEILDSAPESLIASDDGRDDLTIRLRYFDGDGDLGEGTVQVFDCRAEGLVTVIAIPPIANHEAVEEKVAIQGEMTLIVSDIGVVPESPDMPKSCSDLGETSDTEGARPFCVVLTDASGNESDGACTGPIAVVEGD